MRQGATETRAAHWYMAAIHLINLRRRKAGTSTTTYSYDAESRLTGVSGAAAATFVYDGDGNRVKATFGSTTTVYVGNTYERDNGTTVRKYYYAGGVRVAMRSGVETYYLLGDHLGGTNVTANGTNGSLLGRVLYKPWGETRFSTGTTPTTWRFTGQREDATIGLYFYNARYLDPQLGRFISPDTIVPEPGNPQSLNRYSYVGNRPTVHVDPSGHVQVCGGGCPQDWDELTRQWYAIEDQGLLDGTILAWIQDHQNLATIEGMMAYLEANYGQTGAILPDSFNTMYAHGIAAGEFARLTGNSRAQLIAGAIFAGVGIGGANLGGVRREMGGRPTGFGGGLLAGDEPIVVFESRPGSGRIKTYDGEGQSAQSLTVAGSPDAAYQSAFGRSPKAGEPYWQTTADQIASTGRFAYLDAKGSAGHVSIYGGRFGDPMQFIKIWIQRTFGQ